MPSDEVEMLRAIGLQSVDDLFADIPAAVRIPKLDLPDGLPEDVVVARVTSMLAANKTVVDMPTFLGGGSYDHFVPASVRAITARSEFYTSYTPYQPEISQGLLQALWEYQSLMCELTGMDAATRRCTTPRPPSEKPRAWRTGPRAARSSSSHGRCGTTVGPSSRTTPLGPASRAGRATTIARPGCWIWESSGRPSAPTCAASTSRTRTSSAASRSSSRRSATRRRRFSSSA